MAGRAAVFHLLPLSLRESPKVSVLRGGFPEVIARPSSALTWFRSYIQTYLERDVRSVSSIRDLATFRRFLALLATRTGQILNKTELAAPLSVSVPTITEWRHPPRSGRSCPESRRCRSGNCWNVLTLREGARAEFVFVCRPPFAAPSGATDARCSPRMARPVRSAPWRRYVRRSTDSPSPNQNESNRRTPGTPTRAPKRVTGR
jgi:hypothetical protein